MRKMMNIDKSDPVEIYVDGNKIILTKYQPACSFCDSEGEIVSFRGKKICRACIEEIKGSF